MSPSDSLSISHLYNNDNVSLSFLFSPTLSLNINTVCLFVHNYSLLRITVNGTERNNN